MESNEYNPTQGQQKEIAAKSPAKTPAAGTASPDEKTQAREFGSTRHATSAESVAAKDPAPLPAIDSTRAGNESGDPVARAKARIVSVDNAGMAASDNTVDTDGKGLEARRESSQWQDNVIYSNATLENNIPTPAEGLVDIDTRAGGTMPVIATREGWRVQCHGAIDIAQRNGTRAEMLFTLERTGNGAS
ncbi:DUF3005 domain-containing protein [Trinickia caryophylli]|uniref:2-oxoglutarate dehydrogenase n=1 Tax=Trinickia caryophylli TaxID=28094 RepID=A0A1X7EC29_TRICW|nr:DUF3005 domain-containing protein [Trinickia caryophylli]PMS13082.1 DUF3005 domain-containing protein [Trinickia caryophylli]TRX14680.1 DUF3005 domain-containing protein [Trinickia caryophylli]WQE14523.1 DUF3005 domain-containing protein [Trinickia caryophylli]SMF31380.1 Protein of unknown function [Trinickia caryophylli]GLU32070.1 hypothetical protein Busp01_19120 [Trinickia caryophylli]